MPLLIFGKSAKLRCFYGDNMSDLNLWYSNSPRAWMNSSIFSSWLKEFNEYVSKTQGRKVALLIDNASSHGRIEDIPDLSNLEVILLPKILHLFYNRWTWV